MVAPSGTTVPVTSGTSSSEECPPDTRSATHGAGSGPCSSWSTATWAARWFTPYSGLPSAYAYALAAATPTMSAPARPGPAVTATASMSAGLTPALANAPSITGTIASRCARDATSGTTPPKRACWSIDDATSSASSVRPRTIPAPVSSHDVSIPSTNGSSVTTQVLPHHDRVHVGGLVVALPDADLHESAPQVQPSGPGVVLPHLQEHLVAALPAGRVDQRPEQGRSDAVPPAVRGDRDREHVRAHAAGDEHQPGVASQARPPRPVIPDGLAVRHQVKPAVGGLGYLVREHLR